MDGMVLWPTAINSFGWRMINMIPILINHVLSALEGVVKLAGILVSVGCAISAIVMLVLWARTHDLQILQTSLLLWLMAEVFARPSTMGRKS